MVGYIRRSFRRKLWRKKKVAALGSHRQATRRFDLAIKKFVDGLSQLIDWLSAAHNAQREWRVMQLLLLRRLLFVQLPSV